MQIVNEFPIILFVFNCYIRISDLAESLFLEKNSLYLIMFCIFNIYN